MALNDGVLADLGIDPITAAAAASAVYSIAKGMFGPSEIAQMRHEWNKQVDFVYDKYKALLPTLPKWQADVVLVDINKFWGWTHPNNVLRNGVWYEEDLGKPGLQEADYRRAFAWLQAREISWNTMSPPLAQAAVAPGETVQVTAAQMIKKLGSREAYERILAAEAAGVVTTIDPSGAVVQTAPGAVVPEEAGFNLPVLLGIGGVIAWALLGKK